MKSLMCVTGSLTDVKWHCILIYINVVNKDIGLKAPYFHVFIVIFQVTSDRLRSSLLLVL